MNKIYVVTLFFVYSVCVFSQTTKLDCTIADSYVNQKIGTWGTFIKQIDGELAKSYSADLLFKQMMVRHLYIAHLLFNKGNSDEISKQLKAFEKNISELEKTTKYAEKCLAFRSSLNAYNAVNNPTTAVYYLPKSFSIAKEAIKKQPNSPYSWAEYGNLQYCYALFLDGDYKEAIVSFKKAISIIEKGGYANSCNWYYLNTLLFLAKSYEDNKQLAEANAVYDKILKVNPGFTAVLRWKHKI